MTDFYTNVVQLGDNILYRGVENGKRVKYKVDFQPTLYVNSKNTSSEWKTLYGNPVEPFNPGTIRESKDFMQRYNLPTAKFQTFTDFEKAKKYVESQSLPIVIKADGLALGKGVVIAQNLIEATQALENIMVKKIFGNSGNEVVIEEFLVGPEISIHTLSDGKNYKIFPTSQDHKRIGEGDTGPNTGGMGVVGPLSFVDSGMMRRIEKEIIAPRHQ